MSPDTPLLSGRRLTVCRCGAVYCKPANGRTVPKPCKSFRGTGFVWFSSKYRTTFGGGCWPKSVRMKAVASTATSIPCSVLVIGQSAALSLTGSSSACKPTAGRLGCAKSHPIRRFAPWLRKTYASANTSLVLYSATLVRKKLERQPVWRACQRWDQFGLFGACC